MSAATLDFLRAVIREHTDRLDFNMRVILPCVHDDAEADDELFTAAASRFGGIYVRCDPPKEGTSARSGPLNGPLARHLESLCAANNTVVTIVECDGEIVVTVDGSIELTASAATLANVLSSLCSRDLSHELVLLSYTLVDLDESRAALIWDCVLAAELFAPKELRTLVAIACGRVSVNAHCNRASGAARFVVKDRELIYRRPRAQSDSRLINMIDQIDRRIVLFLGAGASASCRIPQGNYLRDHAIANLTGTPVTSIDFVTPFRAWLEDRDRWLDGERQLTRAQFERTLTLERVLREEFHALNGRPRSESASYRRMAQDCEAALERTPPGRTAVWKLAELLPRLVIGTVNFDRLIEDGMTTSHEVVVGPEGFRNARDMVIARTLGQTDVVPILKVHGTITEPDSMVADIITTSRGLPGDVESVLDVLADDDENVLWVWVGCSMRDLDLGHWLRRKDGIKLEEWWVDPLPPRSVSGYAADVRAQEWATLSTTLADRQITESSDVFLTALRLRIEGIAEKG